MKTEVEVSVGWAWRGCLLLAAVVLAGGGELIAGTAAGSAVATINVADFGARGDDEKDDTAAIRAALAAAAERSPKAVVQLPAGRYRYSEVIEIDGLVVRGEGADLTVLEATDRLASAWRLTGEASGLHDLSLRTLGDPGKRESVPATTGVLVAHARDFVLNGLRIGPVASAGIFVHHSGGSSIRSARIINCEVVGTMADGIHLTAGSAFIEVSGNKLSNTGDDGIAVVSYRDNDTPCEAIHVAENQIELGGARGISVVGGMDVTIARNRVVRTQGAGVMVVSESSYDTYPSARVRVLSNHLDSTVERTQSGHGAIHVEGRKPDLAAQKATVHGVEVRDNRINDTSRAGIRIGPHVAEVRIRGNQVDRAAGAGLEVGPFAGDVEIGGSSPDGADGNVIRSCGGYGIRVDPVGAVGKLAILGNTFGAVNTQGRSHVDVIHIGKDSTYADLVVVDNRFTRPPGTRVERFIQCLSTDAQILSNAVVEPDDREHSSAAAAAAGRGSSF